MTLFSTAPSRVGRALVGSLIALAVAACGGAAAVSPSPATPPAAPTMSEPRSPSPSAALPSSEVPSTGPPVSTRAPSSATAAPTSGTTDAATVGLTELVEDPDAWDGRRVRVIGSYVGTSGSQVLAELLRESHPPQAGGATIDLLGTLPPEIAAQLESNADDPGAELVTWGTIEVIGTFRASVGAIEMEQVRVSPG